MLAVLAAATLAISPAPETKAASTFIVGRSAPVARCQGAARLQTSYQPALLHRRDQDAGRIRKLIEMPMARPCLLDGLPAHREAGR